MSLPRQQTVFVYMSVLHLGVCVCVSLAIVPKTERDNVHDTRVHTWINVHRVFSKLSIRTACDDDDH